jgi:hypothetical protein
VKLLTMIVDVDASNQLELLENTVTSPSQFLQSSSSATVYNSACSIMLMLLHSLCFGLSVASHDGTATVDSASPTSITSRTILNRMAFVDIILYAHTISLVQVYRFNYLNNLLARPSLSPLADYIIITWENLPARIAVQLPEPGPEGLDGRGLVSFERGFD